ncbi:hypothetical protein N7G274_003435 [Stereocaulon virgatum]|uniref:Uncharacterized protein n=1 Tax=Stereocaulon virgatum TaxID=373712 RepID=A0ABR4AEN4_9LECA
MHFTQVLLLAFAASTLASPRYSSKQERNHNEPSDCSWEDSSSSSAPAGTAAPLPPAAGPSKSSGASASALAQPPPASSSPAAPVSSTAATVSTSTSSGSGTTLTASFTQYVPLPSPPQHSLPPPIHTAILIHQVRSRRFIRIPKLQHSDGSLRFLQQPWL